MKQHTINIENTSIHLKIKNIGSKETIFFIHGAGGSSAVFTQLMQALEISSVAIDLPNHGSSEKTENLSLDVYANIVSLATKLLDIDNVILAGHSMGGGVVQQIISKNLVQAIGVVFISTGLKLPVTPLVYKMLADDYKKFFQFNKKYALMNKGASHISMLENDFNACGRETLIQDFKICEQVDFSKMNIVLNPTLVLAGEKDKTVPSYLSKELLQVFTNSSYHEIPEVAHFPQLENLSLTSSLIKDFCKNIFIGNN